MDRPAISHASKEPSIQPSPKPSGSRMSRPRYPEGTAVERLLLDSESESESIHPHKRKNMQEIIDLTIPSGPLSKLGRTRFSPIIIDDDLSRPASPNIELGRARSPAMLIGNALSRLASPNIELGRARSPAMLIGNALSRPVSPIIELGRARSPAVLVDDTLYGPASPIIELGRAKTPAVLGDNALYNPASPIIELGRAKTPAVLTDDAPSGPASLIKSGRAKTLAMLRDSALSSLVSPTTKSGRAKSLALLRDDPLSGLASPTELGRAKSLALLRDDALSGPSLRSSIPNKAPNLISVFENTSGPHINEHLGSPNQAQNETHYPNTTSSPTKVRSYTPRIDSEEEDEGFFGNQDVPASPGTPSKLIARKRAKSHVEQNSPEARHYSQSPREVMVTGSTDNEDPSPCEPPTYKQLEESLIYFNQQMKDDHALTVRYILQDAKEAAQTAPKPFIDKVSPFSGMGGVRLRPGALIPEGAVLEKLESHDFTKTNARSKYGTSHITLIGKTIQDTRTKVPRYSSHTNVKRNYLTEDDGTLKFIPYLGEVPEGSTKKQANYMRLVKELEKAYSKTRIISSRESEQASRIQSYLPSWLENLDIGCDQQILLRYIIEKEDADLGEKKSEARKLLKSYGGPLLGNIRVTAENFTKAFEEVFDIYLMDVILTKIRLKEMIQSLKQPADTLPDRLSTFTDLTCLICGAVVCQTHGDYNNDKDSPEWDTEPRFLIMKYEDQLRKHDVRESTKVANMEPKPPNKRPCSHGCYKRREIACRAYEPWDENSIKALEQSLISVVTEDTQACAISFIMDLQCWQVFKEIKNYERRGGRQNVELPSTGRAKPVDWYNNKRKVLKYDWQDVTTQHLHQERLQANPCAHVGPCVSCLCVRSDLLCESICGCADNCPRKFTGCSCVSSGISCVSDSCICFQLNRECGPQCVSCGAIPRMDPINKYEDELFATGCQNVVLQRGVSKTLLIGESTIKGAGFGLYVGEPVKKGGFLSEYAGEVISDNESERRGIIYDKKIVSFLFNLNKERVVDGALFANKTRFINHAESESSGLNCEAKVMLVNSEHRIKFFALRDLKVGEELFFNYGKDFADKHRLSKKAPQTKEVGKKSDSVAQNAVDTSDRRSRARMGKMTAIRGGGSHSSSRRSKASDKAKKTAPMREPSIEEPLIEESFMEQPPIEAVDESMCAQDGEFTVASDDEDGDDDDDEDEGNSRKRKRRRPARYRR